MVGEEKKKNVSGRSVLLGRVKREAQFRPPISPRSFLSSSPSTLLTLRATSLLRVQSFSLSPTHHACYKLS